MIVQATRIGLFEHDIIQRERDEGRELELNFRRCHGNLELQNFTKGGPNELEVNKY